MKLLVSIMIFLVWAASTAQENVGEHKHIILDLKPDFNAELKQQEQLANDQFIRSAKDDAEKKNIFDAINPPKHQITMGVAAGNTVRQEGNEPITIKSLKPNMTTVFEK